MPPLEAFRRRLDDGDAQRSVVGMLRLRVSIDCLDAREVAARVETADELVHRGFVVGARRDVSSCSCAPSMACISRGRRPRCSPKRNAARCRARSTASPCARRGRCRLRLRTIFAAANGLARSVASARSFCGAPGAVCRNTCPVGRPQSSRSFADRGGPERVRSFAAPVTSILTTAIRVGSPGVTVDRDVPAASPRDPP